MALAGTVTVTRPGLERVFAPLGGGGGASSLGGSGGGASRSRSVPPRVAPPRPLRVEPTVLDVDRRLAFLQQRQREYDDYNARPRRPPPEPAVSQVALVRRLDSLLGTSALKERTAAKVTMHEAMMRQKAQTRHFDWSKKVYEPLQGKVLEAVDTNFDRIHASRQTAMAEFLDASTARGGVFLDDLIKKDDYDPYQHNKRAGLKVGVKDLVDPLKRVVEKTYEELELVKRSAHRRARNRDMLDPRQWTDMAIEATMTGHFEIKDAMAALGNWNVAFAGKDNESNVRLDLDFATDLPPRDAATLRCAVTDSEFPVGKRIREYPYRFQDTRPVVQLADQRGGVCEFSPRKRKRHTHARP